MIKNKNINIKLLTTVVWLGDKFIWNHMNSCEFLRNHMNSCEFTKWIHTNSCDFLWIHSISYDFIWIHYVPFLWKNTWILMNFSHILKSSNFSNFFIFCILSPGQFENSYEFILIHMNFVASDLNEKLNSRLLKHKFMWIHMKSYQLIRIHKNCREIIK